MDKLYYSIGEVADILGENTSLVRFWANTFPKFIHPKRNAKGNRMFTAEDIDCFKKIHFLVKDCRLSLEGTAKRLASDGQTLDDTVKVMECLRSLRTQLEEINQSL